MDAKRFPANMGDRADFEGPQWIGQVKNVRVLALKKIEELALEMERLAFQKGKLGAVVVKRSNKGERDELGRVKGTPHLIIVTEAVWRELHGRSPMEDV
jgi:hypothetical protein